MLTATDLIMLAEDSVPAYTWLRLRASRTGEWRLIRAPRMARSSTSGLARAVTKIHFSLSLAGS
jgi:hypothetical protein